MSRQGSASGGSVLQVLSQARLYCAKHGLRLTGSVLRSWLAYELNFWNSKVLLPEVAAHSTRRRSEKLKNQ